MRNEEDPQDYEEEEGTSDDGSSSQNEKKPATMRELLMRFGAVGNFGLQVVNVIVAGRGGYWPAGSTTKQVGRGMIYGSSGMGAVHSPVVVYKERQLTKEDTFRTALNGIREEQGRLTEQNDILSAEIDDLQSEVDRMKDVEMALRELSETQGSQLNELMDLIHENKEINEGIRGVLSKKVLEEVIGLVLDIDNDGSFTIQDREIDRLIIGMNLIEEVSFDEKLFRSDLMECGGKVEKVIGLIKAMIHPEENEGDEDEFVGRQTTCQIEIDSENYMNKYKCGL
mmetsp:Transcript_10644/g.18708  ORF Transcript_10644/g.18708 Transcript_10644/m.18708 type:complete len:283 (-) Transcript_10644:168-1016(-)|eukprot:CAMPEP_0183742508 /NCGR_PEP_ID=MMETSP0737-20130205/64733_1 /TAXON_ID=385413 /ORGANISM="Thalassiosira miniscula, Strain CCMP1093" /LENGTH=282 /DNA_ID=CAMNT_0025978095 /DNA_START=196 /DNA_END=1044 /DNA_ORIENTATION=-